MAVGYNRSERQFGVFAAYYWILREGSFGYGCIRHAIPILRGKFRNVYPHTTRGSTYLGSIRGKDYVG